MKNPQVEEPKFKPQEPKSTSPQRSDNAETSEKLEKRKRKANAIEVENLAMPPPQTPE